MKKWIAIAAGIIAVIGAWSAIRAHERELRMEVAFDDAHD